MTMRERMLAVINGREHDRVPFVHYNGMESSEDVWELIGRENIGLLTWCSAFRTESPNCSMESEEYVSNGRRTVKTILHTPAGDLWEEKQFDPVLNTAATRKHFVQEPEDYHALISYIADTCVFPDYETVMQVVADLGDDGLPHTAMPRSPFQRMWVEFVCIEDLCLHMVDYTELVNECMDLLTKQYHQVAEIMGGVDVPHISIPDNITAPVIGERYFRQYCLPCYEYLADVMDGKNIPLIAHMDGDLKPLWGAISESRLGGIESLSPPPDNDTTVKEAVEMWPWMKIWVNFPSSVHLASEQVIYSTAMQILEEGGHTGRLQIQVSENVPPGLWRKSYFQIVKAVADFGKP